MTTGTRGRSPHDEGASAVEYGLIIVAIAAVVAVAVFAVGVATQQNIASTCTNWNAAAGATGGC